MTDAARARGMDLDVEDLYAQAQEAMGHAYAPYSHFHVGAALLTADGQIVRGSNLENGSYGLTICAERIAVGRAVSEGHRRFKALGIAVPETAGTGVSCGACLQVLSEFSPDGGLVIAFPEGETLKVVCLSDLLPIRFSL